MSSSSSSSASDETLPLTAKKNTATPLSEESMSIKLRRYQIIVYSLTFIAYAMSHFSRKSYTFFKKNMRDEDNMPIVLQGRLDSIFMFAYAIGSFFSGNLGDRFHPPSVIAIGLFGAGACVFLLVVGLYTDMVVNNYALATFFFMVVWLIHGLFQSTGGPVNTVVMGNWFPAKNRGLIFGTWTCHQYTGNIIGALSSSLILSAGIHYYWALIIPVVANIGWGLVIYFVLPARPDDVGVDFDQDIENNNKSKSNNANNHHSINTPLPPPISIPDAFKIPAVSMYAIAFGFFKLTNYTLFFWLPFFLSKYFTPAEANLISMLYDVGMMPGGIIVGWVSDIFGGRRATVCAILLVFLCPLLLIFGLYADSMPVTLLLILMGFMGVLVGGPNNIITSAVAADLALHPSIRGNNRALGTVTGIINGSGSITAALGLLLITWMQEALGWMYVWNFLIVCTIAGCLLMGPKIISEVRGREGYEPINNNAH